MFRIIILVVLLLGTPTLASAEELSEAEIKARDYSYKSAKFGMALSDFEKNFSVGLPIKSIPATQTVTHQIVVSQGRIMQLEFHRERLSKMWIFLSEQEVARVGGASVVAKKMVSMFGRPPSIKDDLYFWAFPRVERKVGYNLKDGVVGILVADTSTQEATDPQESDVKFEF